MQDILIIGGGAAGFFAAALILESNPNLQVAILEQSDKVLQKVKVSGGGRCNVTNADIRREDLEQIYPRGWKLMRKLLSKFDHRDTIQWFESKGISLYAQEDNRMFPESNKSSTIVNCLKDSALQQGAELILSSKVNKIIPGDDTWSVSTLSGNRYTAKNVLIATGSSKFIFGLLEQIGVAIQPPVPSLFTFNIEDTMISGLEGIAVPNAAVKIAGSKLQSNGPLLITHWGLSGPAVLKLSAWAAKELHQRAYHFNAVVNWTGLPLSECSNHLEAFRTSSGKKKISNTIPFRFPKRLWYRILQAAGIDEDKIWPELGKKQWNKLLERIANSTFEVKGKSTFKEEFVTCGGVALSDLDAKTLEHRKFKGLYFAGEVMDIDAITGGYNFQAAWTTAAVAAQAILISIPDN